MAEFFHEGGAMMLLALALFPCALAVAIVQIALRARKNLMPFIVGGIALQLLIGGLGATLGIERSFGAIAMADPSMKAALLAAGIAESLNNVTLAIALAIVETILAAVAGFRHANARAAHRVVEQP
jgi:hypothetical protein